MRISGYERWTRMHNSCMLGMIKKMFVREWMVELNPQQLEQVHKALWLDAVLSSIPIQVDSDDYIYQWPWPWKELQGFSFVWRVKLDEKRSRRHIPMVLNDAESRRSWLIIDVFHNWIYWTNSIPMTIIFFAFQIHIHSSGSHNFTSILKFLIVCNVAHIGLS